MTACLRFGLKPSSFGISKSLIALGSGQARADGPRASHVPGEFGARADFLALPYSRWYNDGGTVFSPPQSRGTKAVQGW